MTTPIFYPGIVIPVVSPIDDALSATSNISTYAWETNTRISVKKAVSWDIIAYQISATKASTFNTQTRIHKATGFEDIGIVHPIVWPISYKSYVPSIAWSVDRRLSASHSFSWNVIARTNSKQQIHFNIYNYLFANKSFRFNTLGAVYAPGFVMGGWTNQIDQPVTHPLSMQTGQPASKYQWNAEKRISVTKEFRFGDAYRFNVKKQIAFNDLALLVVCQKAVAFNTKKKVSPTKAFAWVLGQRFYVRQSIKWNVHISTLARGASNWRVFNKVTKSEAYAWKVAKRVTPQAEVRYRYLAARKQYLTSRFNDLYHIVVRKQQLRSSSPSFLDAPIVHPISYKSNNPTLNKGLCEPVVQPISYANYPGQIALPGFTFIVGLNPAGRVVCQKAIAFNDMLKVSNTKLIAWNTIHRYAFSNRIWFNVYNEVIRQQATQWIIGAGTSSQIRQLAQVRTDFSY